MNPPNKKRLPVSPEDWMIHAQSDLNVARMGKTYSDILPEQICFHAQQSVEKALKAILLFYDIAFPLTHDIESLLELFEEAKISLPSEFVDLDTLTPYAVETRYPSWHEEVSENDVEEAINLANMVIIWAQDIITKK